jgi:LPXTG-motif cell wall-anchored protein
VPTPSPTAPTNGYLPQTGFRAPAALAGLGLALLALGAAWVRRRVRED